jgi:hypothetical protein
MEIQLNYVAVLLAAIAAMIIGALWYSPLLFVKAWLKEAGLSEKDMKKGMSPMAAMGVGFLVQLLAAYVLAHFLVIVQPDSMQEALQAGFWVWLGFIATTQIGSVLWEMKSLKYFAINAAHTLVSMLVMAAVLTVIA